LVTAMSEVMGGKRTLVVIPPVADKPICPFPKY
jgi:hypothetical protein